MRIKNSIEDISVNDVKNFYEQRAENYHGENVYNVTMLQDKDPSLSLNRHNAEVAKLFPKLKIDSESCVLDLACGVGRWLDALPEVKKYRGIDFTEGLIEIARSRNTRQEAKFFVGSILDAEEILGDEKGSFNRVLLMGILNSMNDSDISSLFSGLPALITRGGGGTNLC